MKLNKPKVTEAQVLLEAYVAGLLKDCSDVSEKSDQVVRYLKENKRNENKKLQHKISTASIPKQRTIEIVREQLVEPNVSYKEESEIDPRLKGVENLLAKISLANVNKVVSQTEEQNQNSAEDTSSPQLKEQVEVAKAEVISAPEISPETAQASFVIREKEPLKNTLGNVFQTLVFEVSKLPLAVPLIKLGGIVNLNEKNITPLVGTPNWFMGLMPHERGNLMVVDTQKFLMPEKVHAHGKPYEYLIILDDSLWALACHTVGDAKNLSPEDIRWSSGSSKRPWFAGMVVEYMSALVEVDKLINMLAENIVD